MSVIDTATDTVVSTVPVGAIPQPRHHAGRVPGLRGQRLSNDVSDRHIDRIGHQTVAIGSGPIGVAITPDGTQAYVANKGDNT